MANQRTLHFRRMLARLSDVIRSKDLETMKYLCLDKIPRARAEDINTAVDLWVVLEERGLLSVDDISLLEVLLVEGCAGRRDVLQILTEYKNRNDFLNTNSEDLTREFDVICANLGRRWRTLARKLGLSEMDIDSITHQNSNDLKEQIRQSLLLWQKKKRHSASKAQLIRALESAEFRLLAHQVETTNGRKVASRQNLDNLL